MKPRKKTLLEVFILSLIFYYIKISDYIKDAIGTYKAKKKFNDLRRTKRALLTLLSEDKEALKTESFKMLWNENQKALKRYKNAPYYTEEIIK